MSSNPDLQLLQQQDEMPTSDLLQRCPAPKRKKKKKKGLSPNNKITKCHVAHTCKPSYLRDWDQDHSMRPSWANSLWNPISIHSWVWWCTPVIPSSLGNRDPEDHSCRPAQGGGSLQDPAPHLDRSSSWAWWYMSVVPVTAEVYNRRTMVQASLSPR
jgi:hypothetical protein